MGLIPPAEFEADRRASQPAKHDRQNPALTEVGSIQPSLHDARGGDSTSHRTKAHIHIHSRTHSCLCDWMEPC